MKQVSLAALAASVPLALSVATAGAQTPGEGSAGSGESPRGISTGTLIDNIEPMAAPVVESLAVIEQIGREILDEEALRERYGVVSLLADGTVARTEASDAVIRAVMGAPTPPEPSPQAEEIPRFVGPVDEREQIRDASAYPVTAVGLLYSTYGENGSSCSATLIGPATLITAAHCVYDHDHGWPDNIQYVPAMLDENTYPHGVWEYEQAHIFAAYVANYSGNYGDVVPFDLAVVNLDSPIGQELGWLGFRASEGMPGFDATILSYPGDKPFGTLWHSACDVSFSEGLATNLAFVHFCQTYAGSSGGSMWAYYPSEQQYRIYGINVAEVQGEDGFNLSVRMNEGYFQWISERWR
jgi:V8-like Glu-specific endopeptidase